MGHDAILQVRADREITGDEARSVTNIIEKYCGGAYYEFLDVKRGIDVYITNVASARHAAARIMKVSPSTWVLSVLSCQSLRP